jgi:hypothetical protein
MRAYTRCWPRPWSGISRPKLRSLAFWPWRERARILICRRGAWIGRGVVCSRSTIGGTGPVVPLLTFPFALPAAARILWCQAPPDFDRACAGVAAAVHCHGGPNAVVYGLACAGQPTEILTLIAPGRLTQPTPRLRAVGEASRPERAESSLDALDGPAPATLFSGRESAGP